MTETLSEVSWRRWADKGLRPLSPARAIAAMERVLASGAAQLIVANANFETRVMQAPSQWSETLELTPPEKRFDLVVDRIASMAADVMGLRNGARPDWRDRFFDHGFDSLMALDLRNRMASEFGIEGLRSTVVFDHPSPYTLANHLCESMSLLGLNKAIAAEPSRAETGYDIEDRLDAALADWQREKAGK
jgi:hypothetical protein